MVSPKQPPSRTKRDWYPYYAGFTEKFVEAVLSHELRGSACVVDPWSGSGTTIATCIRFGVNSVGVDVNPALTLIARARLTPRSTGESLLPLAARIVEKATELDLQPNQVDLLGVWMRKDAVGRVRAIQDAIHLVLTTNSRRPGPDDMGVLADRLPLLACFFYSALFATVRDLLHPFQTTNPMWLLSPKSIRHRIATSWKRLSKVFLGRAAYLRDRLAVEHERDGEEQSPFITGSASQLPFSNDVFDGALTSPPYATRIDYIKGTLPELAVLGANHEALAKLRSETTGTPVVKDKSYTEVQQVASPYGLRILDQIRRHTSRGSLAYYWPWMTKYFLALQTGLAETSRTVKQTGRICIVIQDSYYKESRIDLQRIVVEMLQAQGRELVIRRDFPAKHLRSRMNPRARRHAADRENVESFLVFQ